LLETRLPESINRLDVEMADAGFTADKRRGEFMVANSQSDFSGWESSERERFRESENDGRFADLYGHGFA